MSNDIASSILAEVTAFLAPLTYVAYSPDVLGDSRRLLRQCGWIVTVDIAPEDITAVIDTVFAAVTTLAADPVPDDLGDVLDRIDLVTGVVASLRNLGNDLAGLGDVPPPSSTAAGALAEDLAHHLTIKWLQTKGELVGLFDLLGFTARVDVAEETLGWLYRPSGSQRRVRLTELPTLLADPATFVFDRIAPSRWGTADEVVATMLMLGNAVGPLLRGSSWQQQMRGRHFADNLIDQFRSPQLRLALPVAETGITTAIVVGIEGVGADGHLPSGSAGPGLALTPRGEIDADIAIAGWQFRASGSVDTDGNAIEITPTGVHLEPGAAAALELVFSKQLDLVVGVGRTGITLGELEISAGAEVGTGAPAELRVGIVARDSSVGISTHDFGPAIASVLPLDLSIPFDLGLEWSSIHGVAITGSASLEISLGSDIQIAGGVFAMQKLTLGVGLDGGEISVGVTGDVAFDLNVLRATVEGVGISTRISFPSDGGNLGQAHLSFGIDLPERIGLVVDVEAVKGGGFLEIDHEIGRYSGALAIEVVGVGIAAITVIDTQLPGNPNGFAVFASLTITFPGIPLGFGFVLTGLGGIVAINRTMDAEALASGLRNGVIDALLFPEDPIGDAGQIIAMIDDYFPISEGSAVFGPVIEIGWGAPIPLVTAQLGVVISLPDGVIAVLGSISVMLPSPAAPLITLKLDVLGVIDIPLGEMSLVASLYDSRLLETIDLSGDMAMFVRATSQPYFLLSVGGYHPDFRPPSNLPAAMDDLRRMTASIHIASNVEVTIRSYFALTSNTVQFGASINVEASVEIWPTTYTARGWFEFNVLLQFSPFKLLADMSAGVAVYSGNKELMGVQLAVQLEGPKPWYVVGNATFKFFGVKVTFNIEVGSHAAGEPKPTVPLRLDVIAALESGASWTEAGPIGGASAGILFGALDPADTDPGDTVWVRPDRQLKVTQGVAPFDRDIDIVGQGVPAAGHERLTVTGAGFGGFGAMPTTAVDDWFAPAQYESMGRNKKLTRASFELMPAGVSFGTAEAVTTADTVANAATASTDFDTETWAPGSDPLGAMLRTSGIQAAMRYQHASPASPAFTLGTTTFTVINAVDGTAAFPDGVPAVASGRALRTGVAQHTAIAALTATLAADPRLASELVVVPTSAKLAASVTP